MIQMGKLLLATILIIIKKTNSSKGDNTNDNKTEVVSVNLEIRFWSLLPQR